MMTRALALLVLACCCATAHGGTTLHIDPAKGSPDGDGSREAPWRTLAEVAEAGHLGRLTGGETVRLYSGYHGDVRFSGRPKATVTIEAAPRQRPTLARLELTEGANWTIRGLTIDRSLAAEPYSGAMVSLGEGGASTGLVIEDCLVCAARKADDWDVARWKAAGTGILLGRHGEGLTARNCHVLNTRFGMVLAAPQSTVEGCVVSDFSADGIRVTRDGCTVAWCVIKNVYVSAKDGDDNHDDAIQCFLFNKGTGTVRGVTIRGNLILNRERDDQRFPASLQAIGFFDGPLIDFVVEHNVVCTSHWHGISLYDAQGCAIRQNVVFTRWTDVRMRPWIQLGSKQKLAKGNTVVGNYAHSFDFEADASVVARDNRKVKPAIYQARARGLLRVIARKFGKTTPILRAPRLR